MLPGLRFLFAAIVLSISMLVFGLGAAALLRAAHKEFASIPSRRAPETMFAQRDAGPALAMLRVEVSAGADEKAENPTAWYDAPIAAPPPEQATIASVPPEPEKPAAEPDGIAAPRDMASAAGNPSPSEAQKPEALSAEIPAPAEMPAPADPPFPAAETRVAAIAKMTPTAPNETAVATPDQASVAVGDGTRIAETRIATLGGPAVTTEAKMPSKIAPVVVKKSAQARRVVKRRKLAQRARVAPPSRQQPASPFGTQFGSQGFPGK